MEWQNVATNWPEKLMYIDSTGTLSDVKLVVGKRGRSTFRAHRVILAMCSEVFASLFYGPMKDNKQEIHLEEDDPHFFGLMIRFIYTQKADFSMVEDAIGVCYLSEKYMVLQLKRCIDFLRERISINSVLQVYEMSVTLNERCLRTECWKYVIRNASKVLASQNFTEVHASTVGKIVSEPFLSIASEVEIYKALHSWGTSECERSGDPVTLQRVRSVLLPYLPHVRFLTFTVDEFTTESEHYQILTESEQLAILKNLIKPGVTRLPLICCELREARKPLLSPFVRISPEISEVRRSPPIKDSLKFTQIFKANEDVCIYGVTFYIFSSPNTGRCRLLIRNVREGTEGRRTFSCVLEETSDNLRLTVKNPVYFRRNDVCAISLEVSLQEVPFHCCVSNCHRWPSQLDLLSKSQRYHFHQIHALFI